MPSAIMTFVLVVHSIIAVALVATILLQRSEGGALGIGGGPGGLMTARGAGNLLSRSTAVLAAMFLGTSILLAVLANLSKAPESIDTSLATTSEAPAMPSAPIAGALPATGVPGAATATGELPLALPETAPSDEIPNAQ